MSSNETYRKQGPLTAMVLFQTRRFQSSMSAEDLDQMMGISCDPMNEAKSLLGGNTLNGWEVTRRPGWIQTLFLIWARIRSLDTSEQESSDAGPTEGHLVEVSLGIRPALVIFYALIFSPAIFIVSWVGAEPWVSLFIAGALATLILASTILEHHFLTTHLRRLLSLEEL